MATVAERCSEANEQYVSENYQRAIELYTEALNLEDSRDDIYCHRAQASLQLGQFKDAVADYDKAIQLNGTNSKAYLKKGSLLFEMGEFQKALDVFKEARDKFAGDSLFTDWIGRCETKLPKSQEPSVPCSAPPAAKVKHDWYQTHEFVIVTILAKGVKKDNLKVDVEERKVKILIKDYNGEDVDINLTLAHPIFVEQSRIKIFGTKVEVKLKKMVGIWWGSLESDVETMTGLSPAAAAPEEEDTAAAAATPSTSEAPKYPSSSHYSRDWDKLAAEVTEEEKNEKLEGDAGLNQFFQKLYADASDETKRAMMKSFSESGGTVLSTNWSEVGSKTVEVKPPDGMEYKKWEH